MDKFINNQEFMAELFDDQDIAERAGEIGDAILAARSLRLTDIAVEMEGESTAGYKRIQRFLRTVDPRTALWRLFQEEAEFIIGDCRPGRCGYHRRKSHKCRRRPPGERARRTNPRSERYF